NRSIPEKHYQCYGSYEDSGTTLFSTFDLQFDLHSTSVARDNKSSKAPFFKAISDANGICFRCSPSVFNRGIEISNILGKVCINDNILAGSDELLIRSLPPGCYFARLTSSNGASEVVKFVVAP